MACHNERVARSRRHAEQRKTKAKKEKEKLEREKERRDREKASIPVSHSFIHLASNLTLMAGFDRQPHHDQSVYLQYRIHHPLWIHLIRLSIHH